MSRARNEERRGLAHELQPTSKSYSLVQLGASGDVHEIMHTLWHLLAEAIDVVVVVYPCGCGLETPFEVVLSLTPWLRRQSNP